MITASSLSNLYSHQRHRTYHHHEDEQEPEHEEDHRADGIYHELDDIGDWVATTTPKPVTDLTKQIKRMAHPTITESTKSSKNVDSKMMKSISFHNYGMNSYSNISATTIATAAQQKL